MRRRRPISYVVASLIVTLFVAMPACGSPKTEKKDAFARLAREANPIFTAMRPAVARLLSVDANDYGRVVEECRNAQEPLWDLRKVKFGEQPVGPEPDRTGYTEPDVSKLAGWLLDDWQLYCNGGAARFEMCSRWCLKNWNLLITAAEELRGRAKAEGIDIVSLRPDR